MTTFLLIILFNLLLKKLLLAMLELVQNVLQLIILQTNDISPSASVVLSRTVCSVLILKCEHVKMIPAKPRHVSIVTRSVLAYGLS